MVQTSPSNAGGEGLIPGLEAISLHAKWPKTLKIKAMLDQKFNKDFKNGPYVKIFLKNNDFKKRNDDFIN